VFAGTLFDHAYITTAHRGQNIPFDPQFTVAGVGRADVWVFDANDLGSSFGGDEEAIVSLFGDTPRPLAVSADGSRVYAGVFASGNQTTVLGEGHVANIGSGQFGDGPLIMPRPAMALPPPDANVEGARRPEVGLIVKWDGTKWTDELDRDWSGTVRFNLPDYDVFAIDATQDPPVPAGTLPGQRFAHVGTTLFNMAVNPGNGKLFVTNLEAFNAVRFEGPGEFFDSTVRGHIVESRITVIDPVAETVTPRHLNKHIDYGSSFDPDPTTNAKSLAFPLEMAFTADGTKLYVAALGSSKVGVFDPVAIENDTFVPSAANHIEVSGGGPTGLVLDEANGRMFVMTRFDNSIATVNTTMNAETDKVALHNPEPASVVEGRPFLYDARLTSARGDQACASCHIFGDMDQLAWDLGNPDDHVATNLNQFIFGPFGSPDFHPMKGPMTTQSLRGMDNHGPMHWRGDRSGATIQNNDQPDSGMYNEDLAFKAFNPAFVGLIGRSTELEDDEMQKFTNFILEVMYPPNPVRALNNQLTPGQGVANGFFFNRISDVVQTCDGCHVTNRNGNPDEPRPGFFGTDGRSTFENESQHMKVAHLRNLYQKVGMFGFAPEPFVNNGDNAHKGDQVRGFGFLHDGSIDTVFRFFQATVFNDGGMTGFQSNAERRDMESLMLAFDSNHRPIVGQQATLRSDSAADAGTRIDLMIARAEAGECEVVAKGLVAGEVRGFVYVGAGNWTSDRSMDGVLTTATIKGYASTPGQDITFTAVPVAEGERIGIDRDLDSFGDTEEVDGASDPSDPESLPCLTTENGFVYRKAGLKDERGRLQVIADVSLSSSFDSSTLQVIAMDDDGEIVSETLDGSSFVQNTAGTVWKYKAPKGSTGIVRATVKQSKTPGMYRVSVKTDAAWTAGAADEDELSTTVTLHVSADCFVGPATIVR
jgi:hypothetical protein